MIISLSGVYICIMACGRSQYITDGVWSCSSQVFGRRHQMGLRKAIKNKRKSPEEGDVPANDVPPKKIRRTKSLKCRGLKKLKSMKAVKAARQEEEQEEEEQEKEELEEKEQEEEDEGLFEEIATSWRDVPEIRARVNVKRTETKYKVAPRTCKTKGKGAKKDDQANGKAEDGAEAEKPSSAKAKKAKKDAGEEPASGRGKKAKKDADKEEPASGRVKKAKKDANEEPASGRAKKAKKDAGEEPASGRGKKAKKDADKEEPASGRGKKAKKDADEEPASGRAKKGKKDAGEKTPENSKAKGGDDGKKKNKRPTKKDIEQAKSDSDDIEYMLEYAGSFVRKDDMNSLKKQVRDWLPAWTFVYPDIYWTTGQCGLILLWSDKGGKRRKTTVGSFSFGATPTHLLVAISCSLLLVSCFHIKCTYLVHVVSPTPANPKLKLRTAEAWYMEENNLYEAASDELFAKACSLKASARIALFQMGAADVPEQ